MYPLVSIIIPCYNSELWIKDTINSALSQTWKNIEIIVVNDGSTDNSLQIIKNFSSEKITLIDTQNQGASAARNIGLKSANGEYIQFLDADDLIDPNKIEYQISLLQDDRNNGHIASGRWGRFNKDITDVNFVKESVWTDMNPVEWLVCSWEGGGMMHPAAWLVPKNIIEKAGYWNESLSLNDDGEFFTRVILDSEGIIFSNKAISFYRSGIKDSLSGKKSKEALESLFKSIELSTKKLLSHECTQITRHACASAFQRFIYDCYPDYMYLVNKAEERVKELGGTDLDIQGGNIFKLLKSIFGWKLAKKIKHINKIFV